MAIKCRRELLDGLYTGINSQHITMTSKMVYIGVSCIVPFLFFCPYNFQATLTLVENSITILGTRAQWTSCSAA
jgi:hypothetical protein